MVKINRNRIICFFFTLLICLSFTFSVIPASAYADNIVDFDNTNVLDDLRSSPNFNLLKYPAVPMEKSMLVINFVEYCYSFDIHRQNNYGLYIYIYNPSQIDLDTSDGANKIQMATGYDENGKPTCYEKFDLKFCSVSNEKFYEKLFYKFKIIDHKGQDGKTILQRVKSSERRYDISGIEMLEKDKTLPIDYGVGGTYKFSGYATGFGADTRENTLTCAVTELETIQLEVHKTNFRTGEYKTNHRHDLTSVYFSVPQKFFDNYGSLQKIKAEWYEYKTSPVVVTSNSTVYSGLINQIGVSTNNNLQRISLYSGYQELVGASGHYNKYNFGYNVVGEVNDRLDTLNYVFSTNGSDISKYVLTSSRLQSYIESYTKTYANGKIEIPGKTLSADLFESGLDSNRRNVAYVDDDIHHKLVNIDADDTFDMLNYNDSNSGAVRFFSWLFGLGPTEVDSSYTNVKPIHIVSDEERNDSNISKTLLIDGSDNALKQFKDFYDREKEKGNKTVLFRFAETDYETIPVIAYDEYSGKNLSKDYGKDTFVVRESVFLNFDIIELTFSRNGTYTVIPVVSNPIDIYNDITIPEVKDKYDWLKKLIVIILLILLLIVLLSTGILPLVIKGVIYVIILPFKAVYWCLKTIIDAFKKEK